MEIHLFYLKNDRCQYNSAGAKTEYMCNLSRSIHINITCRLIQSQLVIWLYIYFLKELEKNRKILSMMSYPHR